MGSKAFKGLPDSYAEEQVIDRFCLGLSDKEAGEHVALKEPGTIQQAIQAVRKYQRVHNTIKPKRESKKKIEVATAEEHVYAVGKTEVKGKTSPDVSAFLDALKQLEERLQKTMRESRGGGVDVEQTNVAIIVARLDILSGIVQILSQKIRKRGR